MTFPLVLFPLKILSFNIDVCVVINDYHHLRGGEGVAFIRELM